jgi:hypothetical protein
MMKMKKQALLVAFASAVALAGVTSSFAQEPPVLSPNAGYYGVYNYYAPNAAGQIYVPGYGNTGAGSGPGAEW